MADDWAKTWAGDYNQKRRERVQEEEDTRKRRRAAAASGPGKFQEIWGRVQQDAQALCDAIHIGVQELSGRKFAVRHSGSPRGTLEVELIDDVLIKCEYALYPPEDPAKPQPGRKPKPLSTTARVCADLDGGVTVRENGKENGRVFTGDAEVSEFILMPLLNHISQ